MQQCENYALCTPPQDGATQMTPTTASLWLNVCRVLACCGKSPLRTAFSDLCLVHRLHPGPSVLFLLAIYPPHLLSSCPPPITRGIPQKQHFSSNAQLPNYESSPLLAIISKSRNSVLPWGSLVSGGPQPGSAQPALAPGWPITPVRTCSF